jgi:hypothetical protein
LLLRWKAACGLSIGHLENRTKGVKKPFHLVFYPSDSVFYRSNPVFHPKQRVKTLKNQVLSQFLGFDDGLNPTATAASACWERLFGEVRGLKMRWTTNSGGSNVGHVTGINSCEIRGRKVRTPQGMMPYNSSLFGRDTRGTWI